jgi:hypothetical protein
MEPAPVVPGNQDVLSLSPCGGGVFCYTFFNGTVTLA